MKLPVQTLDSVRTGKEQFAVFINQCMMKCLHIPNHSLPNILKSDENPDAKKIFQRKEDGGERQIWLCWLKPARNITQLLLVNIFHLC